MRVREDPLLIIRVPVRFELDGSIENPSSEMLSFWMELEVPAKLPKE